MHRALITATICGVTALAALPTHAQTIADPRYVAVIDAGSSGSRLYLYASSTGTERETVTTLLEEDPDDLPGLSSFLSAPGQAGPQGVAPLLTSLTAYLNAQGIPASAVPVNLLATAGMRNATRKDPAAVAQIYASAQAAIVGSGHPVGEVGTISGKNEGLYSWVDVNHLRGLFAGTAQQRGILEVGGASVQVAFHTGGPATANTTDVRLGGTTYRVFSVSYLGLGQNDARAAIIRSKAAQSGSPCFPNNKRGATPMRYAVDNVVPVKAARSDYAFSTCTKRSSAIISTVSNNAYNRKRTHATDLADVRRTSGFRRTHFLGLASITFALTDFGATGRDEAGKMAVALKRVCSGPNAWPRVLKQFGGKIGGFSENGCVNGTYNRTLAFGADGLRLPSSRFVAAGKIKGQSPTWTRGFALLELSKD